MKRALQLLTLLTTASVIAGSPYDKVKNVTVPTHVRSNLVCGEFYSGDGLGYNVYLNLCTNGTFSCTWRGCLGVYGTSRGTWGIVTNRITLNATEATDMLKERPLSSLDVLLHGDKMIFVNAEHNDFFLKHGPDRYSCFNRREVQQKKDVEHDTSGEGGQLRR